MVHDPFHQNRMLGCRTDYRRGLLGAASTWWWNCSIQVANYLHLRLLNDDAIIPQMHDVLEFNPGNAVQLSLCPKAASEMPKAGHIPHDILLRLGR